MAKFRACLQHGCNAIIPHSQHYCDKHIMGRKKAEKEQRKMIGRSRFYNLQRWRRLSQRLRTEEPVCQCCGERLSVLVDHIIELQDIDIKHEERLGLLEENLQCLCHDCHNIKTQRVEAARKSNTLELFYAEYLTEIGRKDPRKL